MAISWYEHLELPAVGATAANACLSVDPPRPPGSSCEFSAAAARLSRTAQAFRDALNALGRIAADGSGWTGDAADGFRHILKDPQRSHLDQVPERYDGYARALREYASGLDAHQAGIDSARAGVQSALDAYHRATAAAPDPRRTTSFGIPLPDNDPRHGGAVEQCATSARQFQAAYNDWIDSARRCQQAIKRVDADKLHNPHGMHVVVDVVANAAELLSNLTAVLALICLPYPPLALVFLEVSSVLSLVELAADIDRKVQYHENVTGADFALDALGAIPLIKPVREGVAAGRAAKSVGAPA